MKRKHFSRANAPVTFRRFCRKGYAVFASLHREVRIGVLTVGMLASVNIHKVEAMQPTVSSGIDDEDDETELSEVTVSGTMSPLTALQSARIVGIISRQQIEASAAQSVTDLLKTAVGVDVRQRGGFGIQSDISINGGTFDQIIILLNGVNISSPHTGHLAADFPVGLADIERIEILEGAASRVYGASAFGGAINIVTRKGQDVPRALQAPPPALPYGEGANTKIHSRLLSVEGGAQGGSYATFGADIRLSTSLAHTARSLTERAGGGSSEVLSSSLSASYLRSDGATANSDFRKGQVFLRGEYDATDFRLDLQAGYSEKAYGANTFYSAAYPNQWEHNRRFILSAGAETKGRVRVRPEVYWNRLLDNFQLIRHTATGENFHQSDVHGARVSASLAWAAGRTAIGAEVREENIHSSSLGRATLQPRDGYMGGTYTKADSRTNLSFNAEHTLTLTHWTVSAGLLANRNSRFDDHFRLYPGIDIAYTPNAHWRLFASYNKGFRLPTFTDLYYKSPTHEGNQGMQAEESHSVQLGTTFHFARRLSSMPEPSSALSLTLKAFYHRGNNMIDWVMYTDDDVFHSANFNLDNMGFQAQAHFQLSPTSHSALTSHKPSSIALDLSYAFIHQQRHDEVVIYKSNYAMEYLRHKLVATLSHPIVSRLSAAWTLRWQDRMGAYLLYENAQSTGRLVPYDPYATLDLKLRWTARRYELWAEATNLFNKRYFDLGNIPQPGIFVLAGVRVRL